MPSVADRKWLVVLSDALYRRMLVLYPKAFRSTYGTEMAQVFRDRVRQVYRTHGDIGVLTLWPAALGDLVSAAMAEHLVQERHMSSKMVAIIVGFVVLISAFIAIALPQTFKTIAIVVHVVIYLPVLNLLSVVFGLVHSFPFALVIVTLLYQLCLLPLWRKQFRTARVLRTLQPELHQLREQYRGEPQALSAALRDLYRLHGVKPTGMSTWLLLQMPFLYALYYSLYTVINALNAKGGAGDLSLINRDIYPFLPKLTQVPDLGFFWVNLGHADPLYILPLLAAALTVLLVYLLRRRRMTAGHATTPPRLLSTLAAGLGQISIAVLTLVIGLSFPAGIALSWGVSMLVAMAEHVIVSGRGPWS